MQQIVVIHLNEGDETSSVSFLGQTVQVRRVGCSGDTHRARALIGEYDGRVDAIGLAGMPSQLELASARRPHEVGSTLAAVARSTPVVDGGGIRAGLERWGVSLVDRAQPGIFAEKHILMVPGLNHTGLAQAFSRHTASLRMLTRKSTSLCRICP